MLKQVCVILLGLLLVAVTGLLLFLGPIAVVWETVDLVRTREATTATVEDVAVSTHRGRRGKVSRPVITYAYEIDDQQYRSSRYLPGFLGNHVGWPGRSTAAKEYNVGQKVIIHYQARNPSRACLKYGLFKFSVGLSLFSSALFVFGRRRRGRVRTAAGAALAATGFACMAGPDAVWLAELSTFAVVFGVVFAVVLVYQLFARGKPRPKGASSSS